MGHAEAISQKLPHSHKKVLCKSFTNQLHECKSFFFFFIFVQFSTLKQTQNVKEC